MSYDILLPNRKLNTVYEDSEYVNDAFNDQEEDKDNFAISDDETDLEEKKPNMSDLIYGFSPMTTQDDFKEGEYDPLGYGGNLKMKKPIDTKSCTSKYSHSSSVLPRTELMDHLGDRVEAIVR